MRERTERYMALTAIAKCAGIEPAASITVYHRATVAVASSSVASDGLYLLHTAYRIDAVARLHVLHIAVHHG